MGRMIHQKWKPSNERKKQKNKVKFNIRLFGQKLLHFSNDEKDHSMIEKDHSMIETRRLKNVVIFVQTILSFVLSRKILLNVEQVNLM